jgi:hypothetical protein
VHEIDECFGPEVAELVGVFTEDSDIRSYRQRKAALRDQAIAAREPAAVLFAADKLSKVREYRAQLSRSTRGGDPRPPPPAQPLRTQPARARTTHPTPPARDRAPQGARAADPAASADHGLKPAAVESGAGAT